MQILCEHLSCFLWTSFLFFFCWHRLVSCNLWLHCVPLTVVDIVYLFISNGFCKPDFSVLHRLRRDGSMVYESNFWRMLTIHYWTLLRFTQITVDTLRKSYITLPVVWLVCIMLYYSTTATALSSLSRMWTSVFDWSEILIRVATHPETPLPPLYNIRVMMIVWMLRRNIIRTAQCWSVWHNVHSQQHTYMSSSYRCNRLGLSHWDPYAVHKGGCLELYRIIVTWWSGSGEIQAWSRRPTGWHDACVSLNVDWLVLRRWWRCCLHYIWCVSDQTDVVCEI